MSRILYVTDNNVNTTGGEQESTKILLHNIAAEHCVALAQPGQQSCSTDRQPTAIFSLGDDNRLKKLFRNPLQLPLYLFRLVRAIKSWRPDIIHSQSQVAFFSLGLLKRLRLIAPEVKLVHTDRSIFTKYNSFYLGLFRFCLPAFDTMVLTTELNHQLWSAYLSKKGIHQALKVIYNTPGELFQVTEKASEPLADVADMQETMTIGFAGRYCDWKNWPLAESIIKQLEAVAPQRFRFAMAVGCLDDAAEKDSADMFKRIENVVGECFSGVINLPLAAMTCFYEKVDILVVTSNPGSESFGRTVVEAMAKGAVVLTTDCGGPTEIIRNSQLVLNTSDEFIDKIVMLEQDRQLLASISKQNQVIVKMHYTFEANVSRHMTLYAGVMAENKSF